MTKSLKIYALFSTLWTVAYCLALYPLVSQTPADQTAVATVVTLFTVALTSVESACRGRDNQKAVRYNLNARYTLVSILASGLATATWALAWQHNTLLFVVIEAVTITVLMLAAALSGRGRIKGIAKDKLFK